MGCIRLLDLVELLQQLFRLCGHRREALYVAFTLKISSLLKASSSEIHDLDTSRRGWTVVEFGPEQMTSTWRFVSTVLESQYSIAESAPLVCNAGAKQFS